MIQKPKSYFSSFNKRVSYKLLLLTVLFSTFITFFISALQLYLDYKQGMDSIDKQFSLVVDSHSNSLAEGIWILDDNQINLQLEGIVSLPDILFASVDLDDAKHYEYGSLQDENIIKRKFKIIYYDDTEKSYLGELNVIADVNRLYDELINKIFIILFSQGIKTFIVSLFILYLFQILVAKHIQKISSYTKEVSFHKKNKPLELNKTIFKKKGDELDSLVDSINGMQKEIYTSYLRISAELERERAHEKIKASIKYASLIQNAILPDNNTLENYTKENFIFWKPRDVVGGDIYFITELDSKEEVLLMVIDGAGHGVPGAFLTMLVKAIENQIIAEIKAKTLEPSPALILEYFNKSIKRMLKQEKGSDSNAGFDGGILYYNKSTNVCKYAGAKTPLIIVDNGEVEIFPSDKKSVGYVRSNIDQTYTEYELRVEENMQLYIATDGLTDQEGKNDTRYGKKEFERMILRNSSKSMQSQKEEIIKVFEKFKSDYEQSDDITVVGLRF